ncbi:hypothetical protein RR48_04728 [Papilio machaon]|uniref:Uncharacterized protein n=1 Tax=Papilio machaon TaxID=76193 RepID=A0A0N1ICJ6_PAPMA|nr:hypothetical protein RR48_04728 [Papilio machaon]
MDEFKLRAGEKLDALHEAAKAVANGGKNRVQDVASQTTELIRKIHEAFLELWQNELFIESRERVGVWTRDAVQRIKDGAPPLSPVLLYEELVALFKDRMWRRSVALFACGVVLGGSVGLLLGLRASGRVPSGPHARALLAQPDRAVLLVDDAVTPGAGPGEVLVRVQAFSVCARDRAVLRGRAAALRPLITRSQLSIGRGFAATTGEGLALLQLLSRKGARACTAAPLSHRTTLHDFGCAEFIETDGSRSWAGIEASAVRAGLWDALFCCDAHHTPPAAPHHLAALLNAGLWDALFCCDAHHTPPAAPHHLAALLKYALIHTYIHTYSAGLWDALFCCDAHHTPPAAPHHLAALLKSTAPKRAFIDLRPSVLLTDRLPTPFWLLFCATFYTFKVLRRFLGLGSHTDWMELDWQLSPGLDQLAALVDSGYLTPALDKVYLPQDFEAALAHACSDDAIGTTVIRFP